MLVLVKVEISGQNNSVSPENENIQYLRREEQEKIRDSGNCCSNDVKLEKMAYPKMRRLILILTLGAAVIATELIAEDAAGLEVAELSRKENVDFATEILPVFR